MSRRATSSGSALSTLERAEATGFALSIPQRELWSLADGAVEERARAVLLVKDSLDARTLGSALEAAVRRHEILRTTYVKSGAMRTAFMSLGEPGRGEAFALETCDLSSFSPVERRAEAQALLLRDDPLQIDRLPLLRALLVRLGPKRHLLRLELPALTADAESLRLLASEVLVRLAGSSSAEGESVQYADYAEWREALASEDAPREEEVSPGDAARLPLARTPPPGPPERGTVLRALDPESWAAVLAAARDAGVSPQAFLLASVEALLLRLGAPDVRVAFLCDGRARPELARALGVFARWLPVPRARGDSPSFADLARRAHAFLAEAPELEERLRARKRDRMLPEGAVGFAFAEEPALPPGARLLDAEARLASLALEIDARAGRRLVLAYRHDARALDESSVLRLARAHETFLLATAARPESPVAELPVLDARTRRELLYDLNRTARPVPDAPFSALFEEQAARSPDAEAVVCGGERLTYAELNARANRLTRLLRARGVGPDVPVGLCLRPGVGQIAALLAILKAGGSYYPLGDDNPPERLRLLLAGSGAPFVLTDSGLASLFEPWIDTLRVDDAEGLLAREPASDPPPLSLPSDLAYVIATSGSAGVPKAVAVTHANLVNYACDIARLVGTLAPGPLRFATVSALSADLGNTAIFPALVSGGTVHVLPYDVATDPALFAAAMKEERIDVLKIVPSHLAALLGAPADRDVLPRHVLFLGGEALPRALAELVLSLAPELAVLNHYGPTETTVGSLVQKAMPPLPETASGTVPIGRPLANTRVYVLDERREPVVPGVVGELYIGGRGVARGYVNQEDATAERFLDDPFSGEKDARMYRTGDLVRVLGDGAVEFLGRADEQVRVRGHRVELGEVERALAQHPGILRAAAALRDGRLVAYVVPKGSAPSRDSVRELLAQKLPAPMIPSEVVALAELPRLASGKLDRRALPAPEAGARDGFVAPHGAAEETLAAIWAEVFGVPRLSVTSDFFELGGHSLIATQILSRVKRALGVALAPSVLFETRTVQEMARVLAGSAL